MKTACPKQKVAEFACAPAPAASLSFTVPLLIRS